MNNKKPHLQLLAMAAMLAAAALATAAPAQGPGLVTLTNPSGNLWTASIGNTPTATTFTDVYVFTNPVPAGSTAWGALINTSFMGFGNITFTSADLNGIPLLTGALPIGPLVFNGAALVPSSVTGPLTLTVHGLSNGGSYGGDLDVLIPVPEPHSYAMMLGGLGMLAMLRRRRKP